MDNGVIILGAGGHAKVLADTLLIRGIPILGFTSPHEESVPIMCDVHRLGNDEVILQYSPDKVRLVNGVGSAGSPTLRQRLFQQFKSSGYSFLSVMHPSATLSPECYLSEGVQIMAGAIIQVGSCIGCNSIVNTKASVDHDCTVGEHVHIAPGVTISGGTKIGHGVHIGTGANVIQGISIGEGSVIGAGALVIRDVPCHVKVAGVPAKIFSKVKEDSYGTV